MNLQDEYSNYNHSLRLKQLGITQKIATAYFYPGEKKQFRWVHTAGAEIPDESTGIISSFSCAQLGIMLACCHQPPSWQTVRQRFVYSDDKNRIHQFEHEAESRAHMLCFFLDRWPHYVEAINYKLANPDAKVSDMLKLLNDMAEKKAVPVKKQSGFLKLLNRG